MSIKILPYRSGSRSARALANALACKILKLEGSRWRPRRGRGDCIINWGNTSLDMERYRDARILNRPLDIQSCSNKLSFFNNTPEGVLQYVPEFWTNLDDVRQSGVFDSGSVVCRTILAGHSGSGIVLANSPDELVPAPLYTKYIKKSQEYRIHMGRDNEGQSIIISSQRKARNRSIPDDQVNWQVRNHSNGFVFVRDNVNPPDCVIEACKQVFAVTGLDFGAVDVVYNERSDRAYVLEINTAPGLEGQTVEDYTTFFRSLWQ